MSTATINGERKSFVARRQDQVHLQVADRMRQIAEGLRTLLVEQLPVGCLSWVFECRPDISRLLYLAWEDIEDAVAAADRKGFTAAVQHCAAVYQRVARVYVAEVKRVARMTYSQPVLDGKGAAWRS